MEQHGSEMDKSYCYHGNGRTIIKVPVEQAMESVVPEKLRTLDRGRP